jgi:PBP1b-binding outer membrane lipoprotein LpoB
MKTKTLFLLLLVAVVLASCTQQPAVIPAPPIETTISLTTLASLQPVETATPTSTSSPISTVPSITATPFAHIKGLANVPVPDENFIGQVIDKNYLDVMGIAREKVKLTYLLNNLG